MLTQLQPQILYYPRLLRCYPEVHWHLVNFPCSQDPPLCYLQMEVRSFDEHSCLTSPCNQGDPETGNPLYSCPSTWYTVPFQWSWILCFSLKAVLLRRNLLTHFWLGASYFMIIVLLMFLVFLFNDMLGCFVSPFQSFGYQNIDQLGVGDFVHTFHSMD